MKEQNAILISEGKAVLGIEFGSTRIKSVLIDETGNVIESGSYGWCNRLENGIWTYGEDEFFLGLKGSYADLSRRVFEKYGVHIRSLRAIGISGMMHGYLPLDENYQMLVPFRTWRNTITDTASNLLSSLFSFHVPQRWSIAHLCQAFLNQEKHVTKIRHITTLAGYMHLKLTGSFVTGMCEASGIFPIDTDCGDYSPSMIVSFEEFCRERGWQFKLRELLPPICRVGEFAGVLTSEGAALLDEEGFLQAGIPFCAPEGDAGTGMVATDSISPNTGNISAGTSIFAMAVLDKPLSHVYPELDVIATPEGSPAVMVHCNNCTGEIDTWANFLSEFAGACGSPVEMPTVYDTIYYHALCPEASCEGIVLYNYLSGEHMTGIETGIPMLMRAPGKSFDFDKFCRALIFSSLTTLRMGMDILFDREGISLERLAAHGGLFKTPGVGQTISASALKTPVTVTKTAGEGGAWGMALLALYAVSREEGESLSDFLHDKILERAEKTCKEPDEALSKDFDSFMEAYRAGLAVEKTAGQIYS